MPSFDIVSELNMQELDNAIHQAQKEIESRYDLRGSKTEIKWDKKELILIGDDDYKLNAAKDILASKVIKRGLDLRALDFGKVEPIGGMLIRYKVKLVNGIEQEVAKKINKEIKDAKLKVTSQIQGEQLRVTSKSIDELQACIQFVRSKDFGVALQFNNMRS